MLHGASGGPGIYLARRSQNSFAYTRRAGAAGAAATPAAGAAAGGPGGPGPLRCLGLFEVRTGALCFGPLGLSAGWAGMQAQQQAQAVIKVADIWSVDGGVGEMGGWSGLAMTSEWAAL